MKPLIVITTAAISFTAVASFRPIHNASDYNQVIPNPEHEVGRIPAIGFDDSTGEFVDGGGGSFTPPTAPEVDVTPPVAPEPEDPSAVTINCGCAIPWFKSYDDVPMSNECFSPTSARKKMGNFNYGEDLFVDAYGDFWPNASLAEFIVTYNLEGETPAVTKIKLETYSSSQDVTQAVADKGIYAFDAPNLETVTPSCNVYVVDPASIVLRFLKEFATGGHQPGQPIVCTRKSFGYYAFSSGSGVTMSNYLKIPRFGHYTSDRSCSSSNDTWWYGFY
ncbi:hypothetical protein OCT63_19745 [Vibrio sp. RW]|uniref:hypothetical protein n=1 Tax=Vibrio sp. RW TaxID=2998833 RepID=UPI0022CDBAF7|nr:hypothetical protein [Vibrio sp. RW]MDA0146463.1 hypothetical protein [Vibrio sp. RW]